MGGHSRRLKAHTIVPAPYSASHPDGFAVFGPGDDVPDWAAEQIGDHLWEDGKQSENSGDAESHRSGRPSSRTSGSRSSASSGDSEG